jgi:hypothetical protein
MGLKYAFRLEMHWVMALMTVPMLMVGDPT